jgi:hypothetical protein
MQDALNKIKRADGSDSGDAAIFLADYADDSDDVYEAVRKYLWGEYYRSAKAPHGNYNPRVGQIVIKIVDSFSGEVLKSHFDPYLQITAARNLIHRGSQYPELASNPVYQAVRTEYKIIRLPPTRTVYHETVNQETNTSEAVPEQVDDAREQFVEIMNEAKAAGTDFCLMLKRVLAFDNFPEESRKIVETSREQKTKEALAALIELSPSKDDPLLVMDALENRYGWESGMLEGYGPKMASDMIVSVANRADQYAGREKAEYGAIIGALLDKAAMHWTPDAQDVYESSGEKAGLNALKEMAQRLKPDNLGQLLKSIRAREPSKYVADDIEFSIAARTNDTAALAKALGNDPYRFLDEGKKLLLKPEDTYIASILPIIHNKLDRWFLDALWEQSSVEKKAAIIGAVGREWPAAKLAKIVENAEAAGTAGDLRVAQAARKILAERQQEHLIPKRQKVPLQSPEM